MRQLMLLLEDSATSKQAKRLGLDYLQFGRYGKGGKVTHVSKAGKLVKVKPHTPTKGGKVKPKVKKPVTPQVPTGAGGATPLGIKPKKLSPQENKLKHDIWQDYSETNSVFDYKSNDDQYSKSEVNKLRKRLESLQKIATKKYGAKFAKDMDDWATEVYELQTNWRGDKSKLDKIEKKHGISRKMLPDIEFDDIEDDSDADDTGEGWND